MGTVTILMMNNARVLNYIPGLPPLPPPPPMDKEVVNERGRRGERVDGDGRGGRGEGEGERSLQCGAKGADHFWRRNSNASQDKKDLVDIHSIRASHIDRQALNRVYVDYHICHPGVCCATI